MSQKEVAQHVRILGWLYIIGHALFIALGLFITMLLAGVGLLSGDAEAVGVLMVVAFVVGMVMLALSIPGILAGYGLLKQYSWARFLAIIVGALNLTNVPLGTMLGLYTLWVLLQSEANEYFQGPKLAF